MIAGFDINKYKNGDFYGRAILRDVKLEGDLEGAKFEGAQMQGASLEDNWAVRDDRWQRKLEIQYRARAEGNRLPGVLACSK